MQRLTSLFRTRRSGPAPARMAVEELERRTLLSFGGPLNYSWGAATTAVLAGDFNRDGRPDVVAAGREQFGHPHALAVFLGGGDGTLKSPLVRPTAAAVSDLRTGDFNGDGTPDVAYTESGRVSVLFGGSGLGFPRPVATTVPSVSVVADFNGDGRDDLARRGEVYLGNGDGSFQLSATFSITGQTSAMAAGDFNQDGRVDLAVGAVNVPPPGISRSGVHVLPGNGDGTFGAPLRTADSFFSVLKLAAADIHGDGQLDLVILGTGGVGSFRGNGDGTFQARVALPSIPLTATDFTPGDFTPDGRADLAIATSGAGTVLIRVSNGDGTFASRPSADAGYDPRAVAVADLNGDGRLDLIVANSGSHDVSVRLGINAGPQLFDTGPRAPIFGTTRAVAAGDLNGDGRADLMATGGEANNVNVLLNAGNGAFQPAVAYSLGSFTGKLRLGDLDRDGDLDAVVLHGSSGVLSTVLLNNGNGTFSQGQSYPFAAAVLGDFNGDGWLDAAGSAEVPNTVSILLGNGDGTFRAGADLPVRSATLGLAAGDLNNDGALDLVVSHNVQYFAEVFLGNGDGTFRTAPDLPTGPRPGAAVLADYNRDGRADLAFADDGYALAPGSVAIHLGNGDGTFQPRRLYAAGPVGWALTAADFDRDGLLDLAVGVSSGVKVLRGNGDGTFRETSVSYGASASVSGLAAADLNGDNHADLAYGGWTSGTLGLILSNGGRSGRGPDSAPSRGKRDGEPLGTLYALDQVMVEALRPSGVRERYTFKT